MSPPERRELFVEVNEFDPEEAKMSQLDRMCSGRLYDCRTKSLIDLRTKARGFQHEFNSLHPSERESGYDILRKLFGKCDPTTWIEPPFHCDYGFNITVGKDFFMNFNGTILDGARVEIGDQFLAGPDVKIIAATHPTDPAIRASGLEFAKPVTIGNNVWVGAGAIILPGVTVGDNAVIGAGAVVTKNVPDRTIVAGNPARIIREITAEESRGTKANAEY
eukprot:Clim_evm7s19 gene=Clim_evmTU7s19